MPVFQTSFQGLLLSFAAVDKRPVPGHNLPLAIATVAVTALSMRIPIVSASPILLQLQEAYGLSSIAASMLTTLPVLCFGALALFAPRLERRLGMEGAFISMLALLVLGMLVRALDGSPGLLLGTVLIGAAIAVMNVLLPGLIKRDWAHRAGLLMSTYSVAISLGPTLAAVLTVPILQLVGDVKLALLSWLPVPVAALALMAVLTRRAVRFSAVPALPAGESPIRRLLRDPLAWQVALFLGLQSLLFYAITAWLPTMLVHKGHEQLTAGLAFSLFNLVSVSGSLTGPLLAVRFPQQSGLAAAGAVLWLMGLTGLLLTPQNGMYLWVALAGFGSGLSFSLALTLLVLRAGDALQAANLSGLAQAVGYLLAAAGPLLLGWLYGLTGDWQVPLLLLMALVPLQALVGWGAGRPLTVLRGTDVTARRRNSPDT